MLAVLVNACLTLLPASADSLARDDPIRIVAFGDSLTAGYGLQQGEAFPAELQRALEARGHAVEVINAGVSGDTTAGGLQRFDWAFPDNADAAIVALGANDALRGIDPAQSRQNLDKILARLEARGIVVLLAGMKAPRNWGEDYVKRFDAMFPELAGKHGALLHPFFLERVALRPALNLDDGVHPNRDGVAAMVESILPKVEELIARVTAKRGAAAN
ncbi:MAG: arylesterase [Hyphomicrobiaceae bacterium]|nr:arylesterase [Hyphomicrobiaceae bacterium]